MDYLAGMAKESIEFEPSPYLCCPYHKLNKLSYFYFINNYILFRMSVLIFPFHLDKCYVAMEQNWRIRMKFELCSELNVEKAYSHFIFFAN